MKTLRLALFLLLLPLMALAVQPDEILPDPALEARAREISRNLRCVVCQNQSIDDSDAPLARDLRLLVRERLKAGDSDAQVYGFLVARYGDFVLLRPPVRPATWLLWFGPAVVLALGAVALAFWFRRRGGAVEQAPISAQERATLARLLDEEGKS
ncbi:MAG: cytochrome c-type biogenesis protein CcmH [Reyranellaceae bacterium]